MRKIKVSGKVYKVNSGALRRYDSYLYRGELLQHAPIDSTVVGYITEEGENIGICKPSYRRFTPVLYGGIGVLSVGVLALGIFVFNQEYHINPWKQSVLDGGDGTGELDDGMAKGDKKFSYSRYATYDGNVVSLLYDTSYSNAEIALSFSGIVSDYYNISEASQIPFQLSLENEDVLDGTLLLKRGNSVEEYPISVERLHQAEVIQLAQGSEYDRDTAYNQFTQDVVEQGHYEEPVSVSGQTGNLNLSAYTDDGVNIDFANFSVITRKDGKELDVDGEVYNSEVDVLDR